MLLLIRVSVRYYLEAKGGSCACDIVWASDCGGEHDCDPPGHHKVQVTLDLVLNDVPQPLARQWASADGHSRHLLHPWRLPSTGSLLLLVQSPFS